MNGEMWQFVAVVTFFVVVLLAAYWSVFVPRRTPDELLDVPQPEASPGKPEKSGARADR